MAKDLRHKLHQLLVRTDNLARRMESAEDARDKIFSEIEAELERKRKKASFKTQATYENLKVTIKQLRERIGDKAYSFITEKFREAFKNAKDKGRFEVSSEYCDALERIAYEVRK